MLIKICLYNHKLSIGIIIFPILYPIQSLVTVKICLYIPWLYQAFKGIYLYKKLLNGTAARDFFTCFFLLVYFMCGPDFEAKMQKILVLLSL